MADPTVAAIQLLKKQLDLVQSSLKDVNKRLDELEDTVDERERGLAQNKVIVMLLTRIVALEKKK